MAFTLTTIKARLSRRIKDIRNVSNDLLYDWATDLNQLLYGEMFSADPERFMLVKSYSLTATSGVSPQTFTLPSDFRDEAEYRAGFYPVQNLRLGFSTQTVAFTAGATLTGGTSGATATISSIQDSGTVGTLYYSGLTGTFQNGEIITDSSGGSATLDLLSVLTGDVLAPTGPGAIDQGYFINGTNVTINGFGNPTLVVLRYTPVLSDITALSGTFCVPNENKALVEEGMVVSYYKWNEDPRESIADIRFSRLLSQFIDKLPKSPLVYEVPQVNTSF